MAVGKLLANLPNLITLARLLMTPVAVSMMLEHRFVEAFGIFIIAGISDGLDGFVAKRFHLQSELGAYLDPLADKALLISIYVTLAALGELSPALPILVVTRDVMIVAAIMVSWLLGNPVAIRPVFVSKVNTTLQILFAALLLGSRAFGLHADFAQEIGAWLVAASTLTSGAVYITAWLDHMSH